jgi:hypothetical protein
MATLLHVLLPEWRNVATLQQTTTGLPIRTGSILFSIAPAMVSLELWTGVVKPLGVTMKKAVKRKVETQE